MLAKLARVVATGIVLVAVAFCLGCSDPSGGAPVGLLDQDIPVDWFGRARSLLGLFLMLGVAYVMSNRRSSVDFRLVITGVALQIVLGLVTLSPPGRLVFGGVNQGVRQLLAYTGEGASFLFGDLALQNALPVGRSKLPLPEDPARTDEWLARAKNGPIETPAEAGKWSFVNVGAFVAFGVLPTIIFFSSLMAVMYHIGLMQLLIRGIAWMMQRTMRTSGAETLSAAGNIFVGQTEAPLLIAPFVKDMTVSELMAVMTGGFATVAGGVMIAYVAILYPVFPGIAGHLLCASIMSAPAALVVAKIIVPEPDPSASKTFGTLKSIPSAGDVNVIDAAARGAAEGLKLALNVGAMLLAFISLIALLNGIVAGIGGWIAPAFGYDGPVSLQLMLGALLKPVAWCMGVPWVDAGRIGGLLGVKTILNEFYAYILLAEEAPKLASPRSMVICTYALCGFANFSSIAIQLGGISGLAPERRADLARLGLRAMIGGTLAAFMTACVIGMLI